MHPLPSILKSAFFGNNADSLRHVYRARHQEEIRRMTALFPHTVSAENFDNHTEGLKDVEVIFSTWGMPILRPEQISALRSLRAIFYSAGSVKQFAQPYLERGVSVFSAWSANAVPVAEFTLAQILLANKGYFRNSRQPHQGSDNGQGFTGPGNYGETVAILGAGKIGRLLIHLLKPFQLRVLVYDPTLSDETAGELRIELVTLEQAFAQSYVVSNHLPNLPATEKLLRRPHFLSMRQNATFINTGRGQSVNQVEMTEILESRSDLTALLDVYLYPEDHGERLQSLPNVHTTTHMAGSINDEVQRMSDWIIEEYRRWSCGEATRYQVSLGMLSTMA